MLISISKMVFSKCSINFYPLRYSSIKTVEKEYEACKTPASTLRSVTQKFYPSGGCGHSILVNSNTFSFDLKKKVEKVREIVWVEIKL
jgi:hypothetical protein